MTGTILTWVLFALIVVAFGFGLRHIYRNFVSGESDCCGSAGKCSDCAEAGFCGTEEQKIFKDAEAKLKAENKIDALHKLEAAEKTEEKAEEKK